jgi:quinol monooxygenase YgiN
MSQLQVTARLAIHDGKLEEFKQVAAECMRSVREKDSGTLQYDWFFNHDETECVVRETYRDSDAILEHVGNMGATFGALLSVSDIDLEVFGTPTDELVEATKDLAPRVFAPFQSI